MKKIIIFLAVIFTFLLGFIFLTYGTVSPVKNISGCYVASSEIYMDKVCLHEDGKYEQFFAKGDSRFKKDNEASWRSFSYGDKKEKFVGGVLNDFVIRGTEGDLRDVRELDIQPHKDTFGNVLFAVGKRKYSERREYIRE